MLEMWKCDHFDHVTMMEWAATPNKTSTTTTAFFNKKGLKVEEFEQSSGGADVRGLTGVNTAVEITGGMRNVVTTALDKAREQSKHNNREHDLAITQFKSANDSAQQELAAITHVLIVITTRLDGGSRRHHYSSNSDNSSDNDSVKKYTSAQEKKEEEEE